MRHQPRPRVEIGVNGDGTLDEIVVHHPTLFHLEQMSATLWWAAVYLNDPPDDQRICFDLWTPRTPIRAVYRDESADGLAPWEAGEFSRGQIILPPWPVEP